MSDKIEMGKRYVTREKGYPVRILCVDRKDTRFPVVAAIECVNGEERIAFYTAEGMYARSAWPNTLDLIPPPPKMRKLWIRVFRDKRSGDYSSCVHYSETVARCDRSGDPADNVTIVCIEVPEDEE